MIMQAEFLGDKVIINKTMFFEEIKIQYLNFILGNEIKYYIKNCDNYDINYEFCDYLSRHFIKSKEFNNKKYAVYVTLKKWLCNNKNKINELYQEFILDNSKRKYKSWIFQKY